MTYIQGVHKENPVSPVDLKSISLFAFLTQLISAPVLDQLRSYSAATTSRSQYRPMRHMGTHSTVSPKYRVAKIAHE